jgi:bifunctional non-homologous end joining protein LigD
VKEDVVRVPRFIAPQLATLVDAAPPGKEWLHEIKYDGYRALASVGGGKVAIRTRGGLDWTGKFAPLVEPLSKLRCKSALIDGEIAVADAEGRTDFGALQNALSAGAGGFVYYVFDLLQLDGEDLRDLPLVERKRKLAALIHKPPRKRRIVYSGHVAGSGDKVFKRACGLGLEGIISKRADDRYRSGRTQSWLKVKCGLEQEFVIIGWRRSKKSRAFSSILLAVRDHGHLRYCGRVGTGYTEARLDELAAKFARHARKTPPVPNVPRTILKDAHFLDPVLVAEISFHGWTRDGMVRQGSFKGLRGDKPASAVVMEKPKHLAATRAGKTKAVRPRARKTVSKGRPHGRA